MSVAETIKQKLTETLSPLRIDVIDESHMHAGHAGARPGGESHFRVEIVAAAFEGKSRVDRQRLVYGALAEEMAGPIHALALKTLSPSEGI
ncbi:MAG: BolA family protein [Alphaproteobacteria bacterium]